MTHERTQALKLALLTAACMIALALYPQIALWLAPEDWHGAYAVTNYDEVAYSAYINNLVNGKSRTSDPFVANETIDSAADMPARESLFSIQPLPAYAIALPARLFGLTTATAFIWLLVFSALFASLALFCLLRELTHDAFVAAGGTLATLILGTPVAFQGALPRWLNFVAACDFFPFLRRYQPGWAFPLFFVFCFLVWRAFNAELKRARLCYAACAGLIFGALVFSYFYLWTAAAAWFACFACVWLLLRRAEANRILLTAAIVGACALAALIPYFFLLAQRSPNTDATQLLIRTHLPQLTAAPELIAALLLSGYALAIKRGRVKLRAPVSLFAVSCLLTPFVLFNQQIITGCVLQPFHYQLFIANYLVLLAGVLVLFQFVPTGQSAIPHAPPMLRRAFLYLALFALTWGMMETHVAARQGAWLAATQDAAIPAFGQIMATGQNSNGRPASVFTASLPIASYLPTVTTLRPLWTPHSNAGGKLDSTENKRLLYLWLYYSDIDEAALAQSIAQNNFEVMSALFGAARTLSVFGHNAPPLTAADKQAVVADYAAFVRNFDSAQAQSPTLSYLIAPTQQVQQTDFARLDKWYARGAGVSCGAFTVYPLTLKTAADKETK